MSAVCRGAACCVQVIDGDDVDRLVALSDSWVMRPGSGTGRWSHRQLGDDRVATVRPADAADRPHGARGDDSRDSSTSDASPVVGGGGGRAAGKQRRRAGGGSSRASPVVVTKDSSSCGEMPSQRDRDTLDLLPAEFSRASADRFSLRGARNALRRGVDSIIGRRPAGRGSRPGRPEIGEPVAVATDELRQKMERLGCVDLLSVGDQGGVRRPHSSDSLVPTHREPSPGRLSVQLDRESSAECGEEVTVAPPPPPPPCAVDDWTRYQFSSVKYALKTLATTVDVSGLLQEVGFRTTP